MIQLLLLNIKFIRLLGYRLKNKDKEEISIIIIKWWSHIVEIGVYLPLKSDVSSKVLMFEITLHALFQSN